MPDSHTEAEVTYEAHSLSNDGLRTGGLRLVAASVPLSSVEPCLRFETCQRGLCMTVPWL